MNSPEQQLHELSSDQQKTIESSRIEIENGNFHKNEDVILEMQEWLKKK